MFIISEKRKNDIIFKQGEEIKYIFLMREGTINVELNANVFDIINLIKNIFKEIYLRKNYFKINIQKFHEMKNIYLNDKDIHQLYNNDKIFLEANKKMNFDLYTSKGYECLGIKEFCLQMKYITKCTVISNKANFMKIKKEDLSLILKNEGETSPKYYKFVLSKLFLLIKRLYFLKINSINKLVNKFSIISASNSFNQLNSSNTSTENQNFILNIKGNNNHKQKIEILNSEKAINIYSEKVNNLDTNNTGVKTDNNSMNLTDRNFSCLKHKNLSSKYLTFVNENKIANKLLRNKRKKSISNFNIIKNEFLPKNENIKDFMNSTSFFSKYKNNKYRGKILPQNNIEQYNDKIIINNDIINTKHGYISFNKIKKNILKNNKERNSSIKFNIVQKYFCSNNEEKSFDNDYSLFNFKSKNNKYFNLIVIENLMTRKNILNLSKDENIGVFDREFVEEFSGKTKNKSETNIKSKALIPNNNKNIEKENEKSYNKGERINSSLSSLPAIQKSYKKIQHLIGCMKRNYAISKGQKKFIFYKKYKKNKDINLIEERNNYNTYRQKSVGQKIKDYYLRKKIEGYSALINPLHNTYINRQKTVKIVKK